MSDDINIPGGTATGGSFRSNATKTMDFDPPPSLPLQIFLFCAFLITVAAYLASQWTDQSKADSTARQLHALDKSQGKYFTYMRMAFQQEDKKQYDIAVSNFQNALRIQNTGEAHYNLGNAFLLQSRPTEAFAEFQAALKLDPRLRDVYSSWGQALMDQGKPEEAARIYQQSLLRNPGFSLTHFELGRAFEAQKKTPEALNEYAAAARLGLEASDFTFHYGALLNHEGKFADAETYLTKIAGMKSATPAAKIQLAFAQQQQGKYTQAISALDTILSKNPNQADALNGMALIYATATNSDIRSPKMAVTYATRACTATQETNPRFLDTLARSYAAGDNFSEAVTWEAKAIEQAKAAGDPELSGELDRRYALLKQNKAD